MSIASSQFRNVQHGTITRFDFAPLESWKKEDGLVLDQLVRKVLKELIEDLMI